MHDITFCLMTCGEHTESRCVSAVQRQSHRFEWQEARGITPACKALNHMLERCETKFLVPLDSDMILYPDFMDRIEDKLNMARDTEGWHSILFSLWDTLTEEKIYALKIFNMDIIRNFPFTDTPCPDIAHFHELTRNGFKARNYTELSPIGDHVVEGEAFCYAKYRDLYNVHKTNPRDILPAYYKGGNNLKERAKNHFDFFMKKHQETGNRDYLCCIAGMTESLENPPDYRSKDLSELPQSVDAEEGVAKFERWYRKNSKIFL